MSDVRDDWLVMLSQIDYVFENGISLIIEHYYDESGKSEESDYNFNDWLAYIFGARLTMGQHYVTFAAQYEASLKFTLSFSGFVNISDGSAALLPRVDWLVMDGIQINAYVLVPVGSDDTEFGIQNPQFILRLRYSFTSN
jgi:hypothetical protein